MSNRLEGEVAVVTGAGRGIGRAIAKAVAAEGARVALAARTESELQALKEDIDAGPPGDAPPAIVAPTDVTQEESVRGLARTVEETCGRLDILVNNAGVPTSGPLLETDTDEWDRAMAVNARGPFLMCRECIPLMKRSGGGTVVNVASVVAVKGYPNQSGYTASKHALLGMTKSLAKEVEEDGVRVHAVCPGGVATDMVRETRPDLDESVLMRPEEIAEIVLFLLTRRGNAVIDQVNVRRAASDPWF